MARRIKVWEILACAATVGVVAFLLWPVTTDQNWPIAKTEACRSNLKQASLALILYSSDWNDHLPQARAWVDMSEPYAKKDGPFHCSEVPPGAYGYAMNPNVTSIKLTDSPSEVALIFDSTHLEKNAVAGLDSLPSPGRHHGHNLMAFTDGHAKSLYAHDHPQAFPTPASK
jgi:hypothetical protein